MSDSRLIEMILTGGASALVGGGIGALAGAGASKKKHAATIGALIGAAVGSAFSTAYVDQNDMLALQQASQPARFP